MSLRQGWFEAETVSIRSTGKGEIPSEYQDVLIALNHGFLMVQLPTGQQVIYGAHRVSMIALKKEDDS